MGCQQRKPKKLPTAEQKRDLWVRTLTYRSNFRTDAPIVRLNVNADSGRTRPYI